MEKLRISIIIKHYLILAIKFLLKWTFTLIVIPSFILHHSLLLNSLRGQLYDLTAPMTFSPDEEILTITSLIKFVSLNVKFDIFYFMIMFLSYPVSAVIDTVKKYKSKKIWVKAIYIVIILLTSAISVFILYTNQQFYLSYSESSYRRNAIICNIIGVCFCMIMWSKFFDDIILKPDNY